MSIRIDDWFVAGNAQKTNSDWNATSGFAQILNKPTNLVHTTGDETIAGIKNFSSIPRSVTPATTSNDTSVATTAYVVSKIGQHSGDTSAHNDIRQSVTTVSNSIAPAIEAHNISNSAHTDIRQSITNVSNSIEPAISTHNISNSAHTDIRQSITNNGVLITNLTSNLNNETTQRNSDVNNLQQQIDALSSKGDVADIVGTYQDLLNYDTSTLLNKSIIKVLSDSTYDNASSYYKWNSNTSAFNYIGSEAPTYTKTEIDTMDNNIVHKTGNESVAGTKTFTDIPLFSGGSTAVSGKEGGEILLASVANDATYSRGYIDVYGDTPTDDTTHCIRVGMYGTVGLCVFSNGTGTIGTPAASNDTASSLIPTVGWVNSPALSTNVVHRTGDESIIGNKTLLNSVFIKDSGRTIGTTTGEWQGNTIQFQDSAGTKVARLQPYYVDTTTLQMGMYASNGATTESGIWVRSNGVTSAPTPGATNSTTWTNIANVGWVNDPTLSTNVVHRTSNETIAGAKTFTGTPIVKASTSSWNDTTRETAEYNRYMYCDKNNTYVSMLEQAWATDGTRTLQVVTRNYDNTAWQHPLQFKTPNSSTSGDVTTYANFDWVFSKTIQGTAYRSLWADLAEHYLVDQQYPKGTLVQFGGEKEITIAKNKVNAVISSEPGVILNGEMKDSQAIALIGRVPVRVIGKVKKFDKIALSYIDGVGCANNDSDNYIGIALVNKDDSDEGLVLCSIRIDL